MSPFKINIFLIKIFSSILYNLMKKWFWYLAWFQRNLSALKLDTLYIQNT